MQHVRGNTAYFQAHKHHAVAVHRHSEGMLWLKNGKRSGTCQQPSYMTAVAPELARATPRAQRGRSFACRWRRRPSPLPPCSPPSTLSRFPLQWRGRWHRREATRARICMQRAAIVENKHMLQSSFFETHVYCAVRVYRAFFSSSVCPQRSSRVQCVGFSSWVIFSASHMQDLRNFE